MPTRIRQLTALTGLLLFIGTVLLSVTPIHAASPAIVISEVAVESLSLSHEFIEIYNNSPQDISLDGWSIQIRSASGSLSRTVSLVKSLQPNQYALVASTAHPSLCPVSDFTCFAAVMTPTGGTVQIINDTNQVVDTLGWGTAVFGEGTIAPAPWLTVLSLQRKSSTTNTLQDTDSNSSDFIAAEQSPRHGGLYIPAVTPPTDTSPPPTLPTPACAELQITEIVPNPSGDDGGHEFVELYNDSTTPISLVGCSLKVGSNSMPLSGLIEPGYHVYYGLTLPNSSGGTVELTDGTAVLQSITYPANMKDDESYGIVDGQWFGGLVASPWGINTLPIISVASANEAETPVSCLPGKYRNPETNRCRNIETPSSLTPCRIDQVRSPETNRCRSASSTTTQTPCKPDEVRSQDTNRCRKVASASTRTPCKPGQERSPETNRCRKVAILKSKDPIRTPANTARPISFYALGIMALLAFAYALYEYRDVVRKGILRLQHKD